MPDVTPTDLAGRIHRLHTTVTCLTMRATELVGHPASRRRAADLLGIAQEVLSALSHRLGLPVGLPSIPLVAAGPEGLQLYGYVTLHEPSSNLGGHESLFLRLEHSGLTIAAGRLDDGRPYVHVQSDDLDDAQRDRDGRPYIDVDLDSVGLYGHRVDLAAPTYHQPTMARDST
jgi:hypothetical protein